MSGETQFRFRIEDDVGSSTAEYDNFLDWAFYDAGYLRILRDTKDRRGIVVGRTGVGKSALLLRLERTGQRVRRVDPLTISLETLTNRSLLPKLSAAGVNLDPFFRFFWRYVFVVEVLRMWQETKRDFSWKTLASDLAEKMKLSGKARRRAAIIDDLNAWTGTDFWMRNEMVAQKIIDKIDAGIQAGLGAEGVALLAAKAGGESTVSTDLVPRAQAILNDLCVQRVKESYELFRDDVFTDPQKPLYVVIDYLDTAWVDAPFYYQLLNALISIVAEFAELENMKVVVALREDIIAILHAESERHRQREKHETMFLRVEWSDAQLIGMVNERLRVLLRGRYGGEISLERLLPSPRPFMTESTVQYVLARALQRPRDVIDFVNRCLKLAAQENRVAISWEILNRAELEYSHARLKALEDEWRLNYPALGTVFPVFRGLRNGFVLAQLDGERLTHVISEGERKATSGRFEEGDLTVACYYLLEQGAEYADLWRMLATLMYRVGFLGVKFSARESVTYSFELPLGVDRAIDGEMPLHVHPAFSRVLNVQLPGMRVEETALDDA